MASQSSITIEGFITGNATIKKTKTGKTFCSFTIAVNHYEKQEGAVADLIKRNWEMIAARPALAEKIWNLMNTKKEA